MDTSRNGLPGIFINLSFCQSCTTGKSAITIMILEKNLFIPNALAP